MGKRMCAIAAAVLCAAAMTSCGGRKLRLEGNNVVAGSTSSAASVQPTTVQSTTIQTMTVAVSEQTTSATNEYGAPAREEIDVKMPSDYKLGTKKAVNVATLLQKPELPTGCEITALTELLNFYGFAADKVEMADIFMANDRIGYYTMNDAYIGDPHKDDGFGCNAPVIVRAANDYFSYLGSDWYAVDLTGNPIEAVYYQIEQGRPVIVWTTINQVEARKEFEFRLGCGEDFYFNPMQHCVVVYGFDYDEKVVHVADPLVGCRTYDIARFERIYESMDKQAVVLCGNEESAGVDYTADEQKKMWLAQNRTFEDDEKVWLRKNLEKPQPPEPETEPPATTADTTTTTEAKT